MLVALLCKNCGAQIGLVVPVDADSLKKQLPPMYAPLARMIPPDVIDVIFSAITILCLKCGGSTPMVSSGAQGK